MQQEEERKRVARVIECSIEHSNDLSFSSGSSNYELLIQRSTFMSSGRREGEGEQVQQKTADTK